MSDYAFEGDLIKINRKDWMKMERLYPKLDLVQELEQLDLALVGQKNWWYSMHQVLKYRNATPSHWRTTNKKINPRESDLLDDLTDRSWAN